MKLFQIADQYCKESSWKTLALLKLCLFSIGLMVGMQLPKRQRKFIFPACLLLFAATYIPLMQKFFQICQKMDRKEG